MINKKNGGKIPPLPLLYDKTKDEIIIDKRVMYVPVSCGKCMECMKRKARDWNIRLQEDIKSDTYKITRKGGKIETLKKGKAEFVTLTFNTEALKELSSEWKTAKLSGYNLDNEIAKIAVRRFNERYRKKYKKSVKTLASNRTRTRDDRTHTHTRHYMDIS